MFSFLQSYFLYALAAVSLPFLIHLLNRRKAQKIPFSTLYFLRRLQQKKMKRLKLRQLLLLVLRALAIAALVLGFSRPTLRSTAFLLGKADVRTAAVVVLDNSMSMMAEDERGSSYSRALKLMEKFQALFKPGDRLWLVLTCPVQGQLQFGPFESPETLQEVLRRLRSPTFLYGNTVEAVGRAFAILGKSSLPNRECYILTDLQRASWPGDQPLVAQRGTFRVFLFDLHPALEENLAIRSVRLQNQILELQKPVTVSATVANLGSVTARDVPVNAFLGDRRFGQSVISLRSGQTKTLDFTLLLRQSGFLEGVVELEQDPFYPDNRYAFVLYVPKQISILMVGNLENARYLRLALAPRPEKSSQFFRFQSVQSLQQWTGDLREFQLLALVDPGILSPAEVLAIREYLRSGGNLLFFPGSQSDIRTLNERLFTELRWPRIREVQGTVGELRSFVEWGEVNWSHPVFAGIFQNRVRELDSPEFYVRLVFGGEGTARDIIQFEDGTPFLQEVSYGAGRAFLFASALDEAWSNFVLKPIFPPLVYRSVLYLATRGGQNVAQAIIGEELVAEVGKLSASYSIDQPDGVEVRVVPEPASPLPRIRFQPDEKPGIYRLRRDGEVIREWAVNVNPAETTLERISGEEVKEILKSDVIFLDETADLVKRVVQSRFGNELSRWFFVAAACFLLLEMLLSRGGVFSRWKWVRKWLREEVEHPVGSSV